MKLIEAHSQALQFQTYRSATARLTRTKVKGQTPLTDPHLSELLPNNSRATAFQGKPLQTVSHLHPTRCSNLRCPHPGRQATLVRATWWGSSLSFCWCHSSAGRHTATKSCLAAFGALSKSRFECLFGYLMLCVRVRECVYVCTSPARFLFKESCASFPL